MELVKAPNLGLINKSHDNKWVAFSDDYKKIIAVGESLTGLKKKIGQAKVIVMHVLPRDVGYVPNAN